MVSYNIEHIWKKYLEKATIISVIAGLTTFLGYSIITVGNNGLTPQLVTVLLTQAGIIDAVIIFAIAYLLGMVWPHYKETIMTDILLAVFITLGILAFLTAGATTPYNYAFFIVVGALSGGVAIAVGDYL